MKSSRFFEYIYIDYYSATPKYIQLANSIIKSVREGKLLINETLPSINELNLNFEISRDTAEKAYKHLKSIGLLGSVPGKGYYIKHTAADQQFKVFLIFNKLSTHKKLVYDAIVDGLGHEAAIDFYIYNNDFEFFKKLLQNRSNNDYTHFVILPHFMDGGENVHDIINTLPKEKLIILDKLVPGVKGDFAAVYENFEKDISKALEEALPQLMKYHTLKIIFPEYTYFPGEILKGFFSFCIQYAFTYKVVHDIQQEPINEGEVFINLMENDLVVLIERILATKLQIGKDIGVISYNETPLKKIILNGLTTISTDFEKMGQLTAQIIKNGTPARYEVPFYLTLRASL
ncbi:GntR family transcriptional regulator [Mucilaginibacter pocheonensis]|uniref:DNA-binding transcriptional regulator YhcF (GntR family) n=1 Tax=Mucilaginibacter pocheonensis TaxID=398050 RepID=A0ABU1TCB7_9SPHI|nr:GntR family transcriptional regulator [Mucilaginibacter pocheonensis]MDR6942983.1 DNA-binding transcriptional regulator YhcF (GntR family) [Mucilaginibacter pocheonensis]